MKIKRLSKKTIILFLSIALIMVLGVAYELYKISTEPFFLFHFYNYESTDNGFKDFELPEKGRTLEMVEAAFEDYKIKTGKSDIELKITTKMQKGDNPRHRRWQYKYMEPSEQDE